MAGGVNKVILLGNLGQDPESRTTRGGASMTRMRIATNESWYDKETREKQERTEWHTVVAFGKISELCGNYLRKGRQVYIEGRLQTRSWEDDDGNKRYSTEVVANQVVFLKGESNGSSGGGESRESGGDSNQRQQPRQQSVYDQDLDDEYPF